MNPVFDAIRATAALMVFVGHGLGTFNARHPVWPQQFGVVIFFLLSGYLISQTLHRRLEQPNSTFTDYAIDRFARIYSAYLPAIFVVCVLDYLTINYFCHLIQGEVVSRLSIESFIANLFMLQAPAITEPFGSAAPFWTVAIEFWIYMFVGLLAFSIRDGAGLLRIAAIIATGIIPVQSLSDNNMVLVPWLAGVVAERLTACGAVRKIPSAICVLLSGGLTLRLILLVRAGERIYSWECYLISASIFVLMLAVCLRAESRSESRSGRAVEWWASWSYSLYLLHHTLFLDYFMIFEGGGPNMCIAAAITILISIAFAALTERHHRSLAKSIKSRLARASFIVAKALGRKSPG
jgi:peptidoglycan/LPS O-acetylase OafA/YrhL